ncbi:MAG: hypothetical protein AB9873_12395 [Syntrophobacteraceae bacterium]
MKRMHRLFSQPDFHLFAFVIGFLALNWPFLSILEGKGPEVLIVYLYALWALVIVLLFCVARSLSSPAGKGP